MSHRALESGLPRTLMVPSFMTWNSTSRSMVSRRKAVNVISFSASSVKGCETGQTWLHAYGTGAYLAFQQKLDLILDTFCFAEQAFFNVQPLKPALSGSDIVHLGRRILLGATEQVLCVVAYVSSLGLHWSRVSCACSSVQWSGAAFRMVHAIVSARVAVVMPYVPSVKWFMASVRRGFLARNLRVTSGSPSRIIRWTTIKLL